MAKRIAPRLPVGGLVWDEAKKPAWWEGNSDAPHDKRFWLRQRGGSLLDRGPGRLWRGRRDGKMRRSGEDAPEFWGKSKNQKNQKKTWSIENSLKGKKSGRANWFASESWAIADLEEIGGSTRHCAAQLIILYYFVVISEGLIAFLGSSEYLNLNWLILLQVSQEPLEGMYTVLYWCILSH